MKITAEMSQRKRKECLNDVALKAHAFGAILAGGYVRDYFFNQIPKDIDLFVQLPFRIEGPNVEELKRVARNILAAYGQEMGPNEHLQQYGDQGNVVIKSSGPSDDYEQIDVIFHMNAHPTHGFDLSCCKISAHVGPNNRVLIHRSHDFNVIHQRGYETIFHWTPIDHIQHFKRIKDKLQGIGVKYSFETFGARNQHLNYRTLIQEGLIEDPRQVLPQEANEPNRDEVRLDAGARAGEAVARLRAALNGMENEARPNPVHDQARVQPGLQDVNLYWIAIDDIAGRG